MTTGKDALNNINTIADLYAHFSVKNDEELEKMYMELDQRLMMSGSWDYKNESFLTNQIAKAIEKVGLENTTNVEERYWLQQMVWLWYHHAITCAIEKYGDAQQALEFSEKALQWQPKNHPNKITRLLYLLLKNEVAQAKEWTATITTEPERTTSLAILTSYEEGTFLNKSEP
ncbi:MAG: hypothetical protein KBC16_01915 [Candidatus Pacebacteria bacterium]|nr:hypothetical protein [Candidatus Paceibacterota bacterium]